LYNIIFYEDRKGRSPVRDYTNALAEIEKAERELEDFKERFG